MAKMNIIELFLYHFVLSVSSVFFGGVGLVYLFFYFHGTGFVTCLSAWNTYSLFGLIGNHHLYVTVEFY